VSVKRIASEGATGVKSYGEQARVHGQGIDGLRGTDLCTSHGRVATAGCVPKRKLEVGRAVEWHATLFELALVGEGCAQGGLTQGGRDSQGYLKRHKTSQSVQVLPPPPGFSAISGFRRRHPCCCAALEV
jgi:hypothetical protein